MSLKDYLRQSISKDLEVRHRDSLKIRLGERHPLSVHQHMIAARQIIKSDNAEQQHVISSLSGFLDKQKSFLRVQQKALKQLEKLDVDEIIDTAAEVKAVSNDIKETLIVSTELE